MTTRPHPESERPLRGPLQSFDLTAEVTRLRQEKAWQEGKRNAVTLRKGEGLNIVLLVMKEGDRLDEHSAPGPMTLSVHEGRIRFSAADEEVEAQAGTLLACDAGVRHSVEAVCEAVCLLNVVTGSKRRGLSQPEDSVNVKAVAATADDRAGVIWTQEVSCDLNADLVRFGTGHGVEEHVSDEVEVIVVGVSGSGIVRVDREEHALSAGMVVFVPKRARRATVSTSEDFAYLTVHRRRRPLLIGLSEGAQHARALRENPEPRSLGVI